MSLTQTPISWLTIIFILAGVAIVTGMTVGALGYLIALPHWLPTAALGGVTGVVGAFLIARRSAQVTGR